MICECEVVFPDTVEVDNRDYLLALPNSQIICGIGEDNTMEDLKQ